MNALSHRAQHRQVRLDTAATLAKIGHKLTPAEYRLIRRDVAAQRREEQRLARIEAFTDRATARAAVAWWRSRVGALRLTDSP